MRRLAIAALVFLGACASFGTRRADPDELRRVEWARTLEQTRLWVDSSRHVDADRLLATFAAQYAGTPEANETLYWRAVYRLDPANRTHTTADALEILNAYLASPPIDSSGVVLHSQATVLRRSALEVQRLQRALTAANAATEAARANTGAAPAARPADTTAKDEEIARLKKELEDTKDELERIKRRLRPRP